MECVMLQSQREYLPPEQFHPLIKLPFEVVGVRIGPVQIQLRKVGDGSHGFAFYQKYVVASKAATCMSCLGAYTALVRRILPGYVVHRPPEGGLRTEDKWPPVGRPRCNGPSLPLPIYPIPI